MGDDDVAPNVYDHGEEWEGDEEVKADEGSPEGLNGKKKKDKEVMKVTFTPNQIEYFRDTFNIFDKGEDGGMTMHELAHVMRCLGQDPTDADMRRMSGNVNMDGSGGILFDDFLVIMQNQIGASVDTTCEGKEFTREDWAQAFNVFDLDQDGFITPEELGKVLSNMGEKLKDYELKEMIQEICPDDSGKLNLDMFIHVMKNGIVL